MDNLLRLGRTLCFMLLIILILAVLLVHFVLDARAETTLWLPVVRIERGPGAWVRGRAWWWGEDAELDPGPAYNQHLGLARVVGDASPPTFVFGPRDPRVWTGERGEFEFERVPAGEYVLAWFPTCLPVPGTEWELLRRPWNGTLYYVPVGESATDGEPEMVEIGRVYLEREHGSRIVHNPSRCEDRGFEVVERRGW